MGPCKDIEVRVFIRPFGTLTIWPGKLFDTVDNQLLRLSSSTNLVVFWLIASSKLFVTVMPVLKKVQSFCINTFSKLYFSYFARFMEGSTSVFQGRTPYFILA